jgi:hypothetical protein
MTYESEWDGFAAQSQAGIAEALYAAGVDSCVDPRRELASRDASMSTPDFFLRPVSDAQRI